MKLIEKRTEENCLGQHYYEKLIDSYDYYEELLTELPLFVLKKVLIQSGLISGESNRMQGFSCSGYVFLLALYYYQGTPKASADKIVAIDEAQNLAVTELELIRDLNRRQTIFNLYGDSRQHIEGEKGIARWSELEKVVEFQRYDIDENYRNARQITSYCNKCFGLKMKAVNPDGEDVHVSDNIEPFAENLMLALGNSEKNGLKAIIVKDIKEVQKIQKLSAKYEKRINDMTGSDAVISPKKWNLMMIEQIKGLEFETVIVISGSMSKNEKYTAYTRALDELYVYDGDFKLSRKAMKIASE